MLPKRKWGILQPVNQGRRRSISRCKWEALSVCIHEYSNKELLCGSVDIRKNVKRNHYVPRRCAAKMLWCSFHDLSVQCIAPVCVKRTVRTICPAGLANGSDKFIAKVNALAKKPGRIEAWTRVQELFENKVHISCPMGFRIGTCQIDRSPLPWRRPRGYNYNAAFEANLSKELTRR